MSPSGPASSTRVMSNTDHNANDQYLRFLFLGVHRPWKVMEGCTNTPHGSVWEVRGLPSGLTAWGPTFDEACRRLQITIEAAFDHVSEKGGDIGDWYAKANDKMDERDEADFARGWAIIAKKGLPSERLKRSFGQPEYEVARLKEDVMECV